MDCLTNLVGLSGCSPSDAPFTLNQIGYSRDQLEQMMDDSYQTVEEFFEANKKTAASMIVSDVFGAIARGSFAPQVLESDIVGNYTGSGIILPGFSGLSGIVISTNGQREYWNINIDNVRLLVDYSGVIPVSLYDLSTGAILETKNITTVAGEVTQFAFDYSMQSNLKAASLFIGYDSTGINFYESKIKSGDSCCNGTNDYKTSTSTFSGATLTAPYFNGSVNKTKTTSGLSIDYSVECNNTQFLCSIRSMFGMAMAWRTAMAVLDYSNNSGGQVSEQKMINHDGNEDRYTRAEYNYNKEITKITNQIILPNNKCFGCVKTIRVETLLPG